MTLAILIPSCDSEADALDYAERYGEVIRVVLMRGEDGRIRGNALVRPR